MSTAVYYDDSASKKAISPFNSENVNIQKDNIMNIFDEIENICNHSNENLEQVKSLNSLFNRSNQSFGKQNVNFISKENKSKSNSNSNCYKCHDKFSSNVSSLCC